MTLNLSLNGLRTVWTGLNESAVTILAEFEKHGAVVERLPLIEYRILQSFSKDFSNFSWVVFSSAQAVEAIKEIPCPKAKIAAVGPSTATALDKIGWRADLIPQEHNATSLALSIIQESKTIQKRVLFLCSDKSLTTIPCLLRNAGFEVKSRKVYSTCFVSKEQLQKSAKRIREFADAIIFGSPSCAEALAFAVFPESLLSVNPNALYVALGSSTEAALKKLSISNPIVSTSTRPDNVVKAVAEAVFTNKN